VPHGIRLVGVKLEVEAGKFKRRSSEQLQVCPATNELRDGFERVQCETIVAVVGHMSHEHRHLDKHTQIQGQRHTHT